MENFEIDSNILTGYTKLLDNLSDESKLELIAHLQKTVKDYTTEEIERKFLNSFGSLKISEDADQIIAKIKSNRKFARKPVKL